MQIYCYTKILVNIVHIIFRRVTPQKVFKMCLGLDNCQILRPWRNNMGGLILVAWGAATVVTFPDGSVLFGTKLESCSAII